MNGQTYLDIFKENGLKRSETVRFIEEQIKIFEKNNMTDRAEEAKWVAIEVAESEKKQGYSILKGMETREQIVDRYLTSRKGVPT